MDVICYAFSLFVTLEPWTRVGAVAQVAILHLGAGSSNITDEGLQSLPSRLTTLTLFLSNLGDIFGIPAPEVIPQQFSGGFGSPKL